MEPVSNLGKFGRSLLIVVGAVLLAVGIIINVNQTEPDNTAECTAVITAFESNIGSDTIKDEYIDTLVSYKVGPEQYSDISLGQYERSWSVGDEITVYYLKDDPTEIRTKTMTYGGWIFILFSIPFIIIGIYMLMSIRRRAAKTPEEIAEDEERTTAGKLKYKVSSIVIPLSAGIPVCAVGVVLQYLEHNSALALLAFVLGGGAVVVGVRSVALYFIIKHNKRTGEHKLISKQH